MEAVKINLYSKERMKKIDENLLQMVDPNSEKPGVGGWYVKILYMTNSKGLISASKNFYILLSQREYLLGKS